MVNITVAEILRINKEWKQTEDLVSLVRKKLEVSERQAYLLINKAWNKKEIQKIVLSNRHVIYGLPEFGAPYEEKGVMKDNVPLLDISYSEMEPIFAAQVSQADHIISMVEYCINNKIAGDEDMKLRKLLDCYRMSRNQSATVGLQMKIVAKMAGYNSFMDFVADRARLNSELASFLGKLEPKL
jgi:hypothetical protein